MSNNVNSSEHILKSSSLLTYSAFNHFMIFIVVQVIWLIILIKNLEFVCFEPTDTQHFIFIVDSNFITVLNI